MDHMEFAALESKAVEQSAWEVWIKTAERLAGHCMDGEGIWGYSLDSAYDAWESGKTPSDYVASLSDGRYIPQYLIDRI